MTIDEVQRWCRDNGVDARMILRGKDFVLRHDAEGPQVPCPPIDEIYYWELFIEGKSYPSSPSDTERLVKGRMKLDDFVCINSRH